MAKKVFKILGIVLTSVIVACSLFIITVSINFKVNYAVSVCNKYSMLTEINLDFYLDGYVYSNENGTVNHPGDYAVIDKKNKKFKRGDIVTATINWQAVGGKDYIIKRLVALPGDKLKIKIRLEGEQKFYDLIINGEVLYSKPEIQYIGESRKQGEEGKPVTLNNSKTYQQFDVIISTSKNIENGRVVVDEQGDKCIVLKEDEYFLLGDNWQDSYDCMDIAEPVNLQNLDSRVVGIIKHKNYNRWEIIKCGIKLLFFKIC